jgi:hypothetical protein
MDSITLKLHDPTQLNIEVDLGRSMTLFVPGVWSIEVDLGF